MSLQSSVWSLAVLVAAGSPGGAILAQPSVWALRAEPVAELAIA